MNKVDLAVMSQQVGRRLTLLDISGLLVGVGCIASLADGRNARLAWTLSDLYKEMK